MAKYKAYPEYKSSKVNYLGDIPKEWKLIKFGITNSSAELGGNYLASEGEQGIAVIKMGNLGRGVVNLARIERIPLNEKYDTHHLLKAGDFLFNTRNSLELVGKVSVWREELEHAIYNSNILRITFDKKFVDSTDFISYLFNSDRALSQLRLIAKGTTSVAAIYYKDLSSLVFAFPPVREQAKIADFLDYETAQIDTLIEKQQTLIQLLKEKRQAVISHAVTKGLNPDAPMKDSGVEWLGEVPEHWRVCSLKHIKAKQSNAFVDGPFGSNLKSIHFVDDGDIFVIESNFATTGIIDESKLKNITLSHFNTISRSEAKAGDIIIAKIGARFGMSSILPKLTKRSVVSGNSLKLTLDSDICNTEYIKFLLQHLKNEGAMDDGVNVTAQPALSLGGLNNLPVLLPPYSEQNAVIEELHRLLYKLSDLTNHAEQAIQLMQERRTALISAAVTGKIDVRGWVAPE